jgi:hypothetical protein
MSTSNSSNPGNASEGSATPGKPTDSASRQQTHPHQNSQSGSPKLDKENSRRGGGGNDKSPKPPNAK